jgi:hypothetical protein
MHCDDRDFDEEFENFSKLIPYLASKFHRRQVKRMQFNLFILEEHKNYSGFLYWSINEFKLDEWNKILPKNIEINTYGEEFHVELVKKMKSLFYYPKLSFNHIEAYVEWDEFYYSNFLSKIAKKVIIRIYNDDL